MCQSNKNKDINGTFYLDNIVLIGIGLTKTWVENIKKNTKFVHKNIPSEGFNKDREGLKSDLLLVVSCDLQ